MTDIDDPYVYAACRGVDTHVFYPETDYVGRPPVDPWAEARAICADCPIRRRCLADHRKERYGMWGGTTPEDRGFIRTRGRPSPQTLARILDHINGAEFTLAGLSSTSRLRPGTTKSAINAMIADGTIVASGPGRYRRAT